MTLTEFQNDVTTISELCNFCSENDIMDIFYENGFEDTEVVMSIIGEKIKNGDYSCPEDIERFTNGAEENEGFYKYDEVYDQLETITSDDIADLKEQITDNYYDLFEESDEDDDYYDDIPDEYSDMKTSFILSELSSVI